jgi:hypothetical protein
VELGSVQPLRGDVFTGVLAIDGDLELGVKVDGGAELSPRTKLLSVPYAHRADYVNRFPKPHYDSGWTAIAPGASKTFNHNLSGDVDDYVVDVQFKSSSALYAVHQQYYGMNHDDMGGFKGAYWCKLTTSGINVVRGGADLDVEQVRVRIWRIE